MNPDILTKIAKIDFHFEEIPYSILPLLYDKIVTKELLHSDIIASFLNPNSGHNCGDLFVKKFLSIIGINDSPYTSESIFNIYTEYPIDKKRRIDILITWDKYAVIIENKLNNAIDQKDQLTDYYKAIHSEIEGTNPENKYNVLKVVYLPLDKNKTAPIHSLSDELKNKIVNIYPEKLIEWLSKCPDNEIAKECAIYIKLIKYINLKNQIIMNIGSLYKNLDNNELRTVFSLAKDINTNEWKIYVLNQIKQKLVDKGLAIKFDIKESRYAEIYYENYTFWVEIFYYIDNIKLWIADKTNSNDPIKTEIADLGFKHDTMERTYHYFKNKDMHHYDFPTNDNYEKLVEHIVKILSKSVEQNYTVS